MAYCPFGSFALRSEIAEGLMFDPFGATETPPKTPLWPPNSWPREAADRSPRAGRKVVLFEELETPFAWSVPS